MKPLIEMLTSEPSVIRHHDPVFDLAAIVRTAKTTRDLPNSGLLAVNIEDELHVSFVVFREAMGPSTKDGVVVDGAKMEVLFHGSGPSGSLRELRHTNWGEDGYIFDPDMSIIGAAFTALGEWFDVAGAPKK